MRVAGRRLAALTAVIALGVGAAGCGGGSGRDHALYEFGHMAGYVWVGHVRTVGASWSVPRITSHGEAHASTWIGAQAPGALHRPPFIQVGTLEGRGDDRVSSYAAFWTDTQRGFHPEILFRLRPGDTVTARLTLGGARWHVLIDDLTSHRASTFSTSEEGSGGFNLAEWLQEDPSETSGNVTPYPALSRVTMRRLMVDGARPGYSAVFAQWMTLPGRDLAPTPLRAGAFGLTRTMVTPAGRRYLAIAHAQNVSAHRLDGEAGRFTQRTPPRELERVSSAAVVAQRRFVDGLQAGGWPPAARGPIDSLLRAVRAEMRVFAAAAQHPPSLAAWRRQLLQITPILLGLGHRVRRALQLPEPPGGQLSTSGSRG
jgi:hypothetical protein